MCKPIAMILLILILSACTPVAPTAAPTQTPLPTEAALGTPTLIPTPIPDTLFMEDGTPEQAAEMVRYTDFDPTHKAEPIDGLDLSQEIMIAPQSAFFPEVDQYR